MGAVKQFGLALADAQNEANEKGIDLSNQLDDLLMECDAGGIAAMLAQGASDFSKDCIEDSDTSYWIDVACAFYTAHLAINKAKCEKAIADNTTS